MELEKIEILMAVYNGEKFIAEQIHSILNQTYSNFHLIVRDNCSLDATVEIVQSLIEKNPGKISLLISEKNEGPVGNFSALLNSSNAAYVMFADSDDVWKADKVAKTIEKMQEMENMHGRYMPILVHTDLSVVTADLKVIDPSFWNYTYLKPHSGRSLSRQLVQNSVTGCTVMVNRSLADIAKPIPLDCVMHDWWLGLTAAAFGKIGVVNVSTMLYRQHEKNDTGAKKYTFFRKKRTPEEMQKEERFKDRWLQQAVTFLERYSTKLSKKQMAKIEAFLSHQKGPILYRAYLIVRYGLYKHGFLRNLLHFFLFFRKLISKPFHSKAWN